MTQSQEKITRESRFAVVMYGGVSLAVYMNGIAQELLNLVRSTAPDPSVEAATSGTLHVYRELAAYLSRTDNDAFNRRFVVDIISGTSAGGINGICLAKGLVRGLGNLRTLEQTWLVEGDIDKLLNDQESQPRKYSPKEPRTSLFNSQRMFGKLFEAFTNMETEAVEGNRKPVALVESMDLFVTATDLRGLQLPVLLGNGVANERIHKHVFPFTYRAGEYDRKGQLNHFTGEFDTMLALASRCTSSFPAAFEPVKIEDIRLWLSQQQPEALKTFETNFGIWQQLFFSAYDNAETIVPLEQREFADGGYLDNRPFGHAIHAIHAREADCPLDRKLLFIDPVPETREERQQRSEISFLKNSILALHSLPGYETIREELDDLSRRNDWITTVSGITEQMKPQIVNQQKSIIYHHFDEFYRKHPDRFPLERIKEAKALLLSATTSAPTLPEPDNPVLQATVKFWKYVSRRRSSQATQEELTGEEQWCPKFDSRDFDDMTRILGRGYATYHFTRLDLLTKELSHMIVRAMNASHNRELAEAVEQIVGAWRAKHFVQFTNPSGPDGWPKTENMFFRYYDIDFRIRRLNFFRTAIEDAIRKRSASELYFGLLPSGHEHDRWSDELQQAITIFYRQTVTGLRSLYRLRSLLLSGSVRNPLVRRAAALRARIESLLSHDGPGSVRNANGHPSFPKDFAEIAARFDGSTPEQTLHRKPFRTFFDRLMQRMHNVVRSGRPGAAMTSENGSGAFTGTEAVSSLVYEAFAKLGDRYPELAGRMRYIYDYGYDLFDLTSLPLLSGGEFGEGTIVDTFRISPADAASLWDDKRRAHSKLAGTSMGAFGGFLDIQWRRNDIMWGRLDAAERIIAALIPEGGEAGAIRQELILKAQHEILMDTTEHWMGELRSSRWRSVIKGTESRELRQYEILDEIRKALVEGPVVNARKPGEPVFDPPWKQRFLESYDFDWEVDLATNLRRVGRTSSIVSSMVDRLEGGEGIREKISSYLKKLSWILLGMLDFSTPKSLQGVLGRYWLQLATLISLLLCLGGGLLGTVSSFRETSLTVMAVGAVLFFVVLAVWLFRYGIERFIIKLPVTYRTRLMLRLMATVAGFILFAMLFLAAEALIDSGGGIVELYLSSLINITRKQFGWIIP